jgi:hypothetical protein
MMATTTMMTMAAVALQYVAAMLLLLLLPADSVEGAGEAPRQAGLFAPAPPGAWTWNAINGSRCMSGEETGVWIKYGPEGAAGGELGIYLSGGGACFNLETCLSAAHVAKPGAPANGGIWNTQRADNPFQNYSWIVVPYCTGDVHIGDRVAREDGALRHFQGKANLQLVMARAVASFARTEVFVVTGESAGGFGAASSYSLLRGFWPLKNTRGVLLDDSGPILDDIALAPCLQSLWRRTWSLNSTLPPRCPCVGDEGNLVSVWNFTRCRWPGDSFGLISSLDDETISTFFAYGELDCKNSVVPVGYTKLAGGLKRLAATGQALYMMEGSVHTHTGSKDSFFTQRSFGNVSLLSWVTDLVKGNTPRTVGPSS